MLVPTLSLTWYGLTNSLAGPAWCPRVPPVGWASWIGWCDFETQQGQARDSGHLCPLCPRGLGAVPYIPLEVGLPGKLAPRCDAVW